MSAPLPPSPAESPDAPPGTPPAPGRGRVIVAGWAVYGGATVLLYEASRTAPGTSLRWTVPVTLAVAGFWAAVTPLVRGLVRRLAPGRVGRARSLALHGLAALTLALAGLGVRWAVVRALDGAGAPPFLSVVGRLLDYQLCLYALLVSVTAAADTHRDYVGRTRRALTLEAQLARARLEFLQRQLQPHFLFNVLNAVAELTRESPEQAARMLRQLARLLRAATDHMADEEVPLIDELTVLDAYAEVQRTRFGDGLVVAYCVEPGARDALVPPFVLQPLVENAIRHGRAARAGRGRVTVTAAARDGRLRLAVADDGAGDGRDDGRDVGGEDGADGRPPAAAAPRRGIGLANTAARLEQLYGAAHRLDVRVDAAGGGGSTVTLEVPLRRAPALTRRGTPPRGAPRGGTRPAPADAPAVVDLFAPERRLHPPRGLTAWARAQARRSDRPAPRRAGAASAAAGTPDADALPLRGVRQLAALWAAAALCWTVQVLLVRWAVGGASAVRMAWRWDTALQCVSAALWLLLTPAVLRVARAVRITRERWAVPVAVHAALAVAIAAGQVALSFRLMGASPALLGIGAAESFSLNVFIYGSLVAWTHARLFAAWYQERETASARLAADLARTRLRTLAVEVDPDYVTALLTAAAELAPARPAEAERLVEHAADLLRAMLGAPGSRIPTLWAELALLRQSLGLLERGTGRPVRLCVQVPTEWERAWVAGDGLRSAPGLAAARLDGGGVDVVVAPAEPAPPDGPPDGAPSPFGVRVGRLVVRVTPAACRTPCPVPS